MKKTIIGGFLVLALGLGVPSAIAAPATTPCMDYTPGVDQTLPPCGPPDDGSTLDPAWAHYYAGWLSYFQLSMHNLSLMWLDDEHQLGTLRAEAEALQSRVTRQRHRIHRLERRIHRLRVRLAGQ